jgi:hypothetical protein
MRMQMPSSSRPHVESAKLSFTSRYFRFDKSFGWVRYSHLASLRSRLASLRRETWSCLAGTTVQQMSNLHRHLTLTSMYTPEPDDELHDSLIRVKPVGPRLVHNSTLGAWTVLW